MLSVFEARRDGMGGTGYTGVNDGTGVIDDAYDIGGTGGMDATCGTGGTPTGGINKI